MANAAVASAQERGAELKRQNIVIRTYDLWKTYLMGDQEINAVSGVDIEIKRGEYVAIMGPSGSGKSTLMNLIGCLDTPSKGDYFINGPSLSARCPMTNWLVFATTRLGSFFKRSTCCLAQPLCTMSNCR
jgi:putative ABC transport system ATP-binding protein